MDCALRIEEIPRVKVQSSTRNAQAATPRGFSLLEIILVMVLIGIAAAIAVPAVNSAFVIYHLERGAEDFQYRISHTRLQAMETGVPYAFTFRPESDQFIVWACEPLNLNAAQSGTGTISTAVAGAVASGDAYDRHYFTLNDKPENQEFRFLTASLDESLASMSLSHEGRIGQVGGTSGDSVAASSILSQRKLGLVAPSIRSMAALQIPGLQLGDVVEPVVFEPDGTADRDVIIRIADRTNRYVELTIHSLTGAITVSNVLSPDDFPTSGQSATTVVQQRTNFVTPSRSREIRQGIGGGQ